MDHPHPPIYLSHRGELGRRSAERLRASLVELFGEAVIDLGDDAELTPSFDAGSVLLVLLTPDYAGEALDRGVDGAAASGDPVRRHLQAAQAGRAHLQLLRIDHAPPLLAHGLPPDLVSLAAQPSLSLRHAHWGEDLAGLAQGLVALGFLPREGATRARAPQGWRRSVLALGLAGLAAGGGWLAYDAHLDRSEQHHLMLAQQAQFSVQPDLEQARAAYLRALEARPDSALAHYHLAHLLLRERDLPGARLHFAAALRSDQLPAARRVDANRLLLALEPVDEPAPQRRDTAALAVHAPLLAGASDGGLEIPTEPTAAGLPTPPAGPRASGRAPIEQIAAQAERAALAALRPPPSADFRYAADAPALALLAGRVPPSSDQQREIERQLDALYAADPQVRLSAASELLLTRELHSDALPLAIERAEAQLLHRAGSAAVNDAAMLTLDLLQGASPLTLVLHKNAVLRFVDAASLLGPAARQHGDQLRDRLASFTRLPQPVVYLQLANEAQRPFALQLATQLAEAGWLVPEFVVVGDSAAPEHTEVRAQGGSHRGLARWMRRLTSDRTGQPTDLEALREAQPSGDVYEIWLNRDLCRRSGHKPTGCSG